MLTMNTRMKYTVYQRILYIYIERLDRTIIHSQRLQRGYDDILMKEIDKEYLNIVKPLLEKKDIQDLALYTQHHAVTRLEHSIAVSYYSYRIAKRFHWRYREVARAGVMHDMFYYDWRTTKFTQGTHAYVHPRIALMNAEAMTTVSPLEKDIILHHMFMSNSKDYPHSKEAFLVSMVDKYEAVSEYLRGKYSKYTKHTLKTIDI